MQCGNSRDFDNATARTFLLTHGTTLRLSCPRTSQQNGKPERVIHSTNDIMHTLLFQASMPPPYWVEALHVATYLLNHHPSKPLNFGMPYQALCGAPPSYNHLWVFGCRCYPNLSSKSIHKFAPHSTTRVLLGYLSNHKGYRCLELSSICVIISRRVFFDEHSFPFADISPSPFATTL